MIKDYKIYNIDENDSLVYAVSFVENPAVETNFVYLNEDEKPKRYVKLESDEKRMVYGCALRADFPIYRRYGYEEFYITFSSDAIEKLSQKFLKKGFQANMTQDHLSDVQGVTVVESWIKMDAEKDKSIALGLDDVAVGSWFIGCSVDDDNVWNDIKEGRWSGFSIEAEVLLNEIKMEKQMNTNLENNENFWDRMKELIASFFTKEEVEQVEETVELAEEEEVEAQIEEEVPVDPIVEEVVDTVETIDETPEEVKEDLQAIVDGLNEKIAEMEGQLAAKDAEIEELKKVNTELSAQPSAKQIKVNASHNEESISFLDYASGRLKLK